MPDSPALAATQRWVREFVIGINLCPFAAAPAGAGRIRFVVCNSARFVDIYRELLAEIEAFLGLSPKQAETGLFILDSGLADFEEFLDLLDVADTALDQAGLRGVLQLASFHPNYVFEGAGVDDPANYTNRSPYPMLHLIREAGLGAALETYPDPEAIPERNIRALRDLGLVEARRRLAACRDSD